MHIKLHKHLQSPFDKSSLYCTLMMQICAFTGTPKAKQQHPKANRFKIRVVSILH